MNQLRANTILLLGALINVAERRRSMLDTGALSLDGILRLARKNVESDTISTWALASTCGELSHILGATGGVGPFTLARIYADCGVPHSLESEKQLLDEVQFE